MGTWGTSLYDNDTACDVRDEYIEGLKRGEPNEQITKELLENNICDEEPEEEAIVWIALADVQWNYGRLIAEVKDKANYFLSNLFLFERWKEIGETEFIQWTKTLTEVKEKLNSPMPPIKKVSKYRIYQCKWNLGDVFAYRFNSEYSKQKGFCGRYIVFRKVSESGYWPGHIVPVVQVYKAIYDRIPSVCEIQKTELLVMNFNPVTLSYKPDIKRQYYINLVATAEKRIPKEHLVFVGNLQGDDLVPFKGRNHLNGYFSVGWDGERMNEIFEEFILDRYNAWYYYENTEDGSLS